MNVWLGQDEMVKARGEMDIYVCIGVGMYHGSVFGWLAGSVPVPVPTR